MRLLSLPLILHVLFQFVRYNEDLSKTYVDVSPAGEKTFLDAEPELRLQYCRFDEVVESHAAASQFDYSDVVLKRLQVKSGVDVRVFRRVREPAVQSVAYGGYYFA